MAARSCRQNLDLELQVLSLRQPQHGTLQFTIVVRWLLEHMPHFMAAPQIPFCYLYVCVA